MSNDNYKFTDAGIGGFMQYFSVLLLLNIIFVSCDGANNPILLNVDRDIPASEEFDASYGFWGPNGETIYFTHSEELGTDPKPGKSDQLWKLNLETGERTKIHDGRILFPDISPDGEWFVFNSFAVPQYLYKMRSDGTKLQRLTGPNSPNPEFEYTIQGDWSPDGNHILFSLSAGDPRGVSLMDSSGANANIIIPFGVQPNWASAGNNIIYANYDTTKAQQNQEQIYIASPQGENVQKITDLKNTLFNIHDPSISPDSKAIVFTYNYEVYVMSAEGNEVTQLTEGLGFAARPEWDPDGQTILFSRIIRNVSKRLYYLDVTTREVTPVFPKKDRTNLN